MAIEQHKDVESGEHLQVPFIQPEEAACNKEVGSDKSVENGSIGMVLLSTLVAVCGSFTFGTCVSIFKHKKNYNWQFGTQPMLSCTNDRTMESEKFGAWLKKKRF